VAAARHARGRVLRHPGLDLGAVADRGDPAAVHEYGAVTNLAAGVVLGGEHLGARQ